MSYRNWTREEAANNMLRVYENRTVNVEAAEDLTYEFLARKFASISVSGKQRYCDNGALMVWEDSEGNLAFIDYITEQIGVLYAGFTYVASFYATQGNLNPNRKQECAV